MAYSIMAGSTNKTELSDSEKNYSNKSNKTTLNFRNHVVQRRRPLSFPKTKKDIYITHKESFKAQLNQCHKRFDLGESEIIIHGLGTAVNRACNLALQLKNNHNGILDLEVNTSTVELTDDLQPLTDDYDDQTITNRNKSAIHIRLFKTVEIGPLKYTK